MPTALILSQNKSFHCKANAGVKQNCLQATYCDHKTFFNQSLVLYRVSQKSTPF